jgi:hypothetical protein
MSLLRPIFVLEGDPVPASGKKAWPLFVGFRRIQRDDDEAKKGSAWL